MGMDMAVSAQGVATADHEATKLRVGMLLLIATDVVFVACLFVAYIYLHALNVESMWLPKGVHMPPMIQGTILAALIVVSAAAYGWADLGLRRGNQAQFRTGVVVAYLLWLAALIGQVWQLAHLGFMPGSGGFASAFIGLSGYHAVHLAIGAVLGLMLVSRVLRGCYTHGQSIGVEIIGYFWYWITVMAVVMWLLMSFT